MTLFTIREKINSTAFKYCCALIVFLATALTSIAQVPANDNACQAITLTPSTTCTYETHTNLNATTSTGMATPGCGGFTGGTSADVWFRAVVPAGGALTFDMQAGGMTNGAMAVYRGNTCNLLVRIACDDNSSANANMPKLTVTGLVPGSTVYVRVWAANNVNGTFGICATIPVNPPVNDDVCAATELIPGATCTFQTFTNEAATATPNVLDPGCAGYLGGDVWFKTVVPAGGAILVNTQADQMLDGGMAIYAGSACNASLVLVDCDDNDGAGDMPTLTTGGLNPGDTVWIRIWENGNNNNGRFGICVTLPPPPPANDGPCGATELPVATSCTYQPFTTTNATASGLVPDPGCGNYLGGDVWFTAIVPAGGAISIDLDEGDITDAAMSVYSGTCNNLTLIACDEDASSNGTMPKVTLGGLTVGDTLWIRVWEEGNNVNGTFSICANIPPPPPSNDEICNSILLPVEATCNYQTFTNENATNSNGVPAPACPGTGFQGGDVWFKAVVPAGGAVTIDTDDGVVTDAAMAVYSGNCSAPVFVECDDDDSPNGAMPSVTLGGLTPGDTLWIRIWEFQNDANGTFGICVTIPPPAPDNDNPCQATVLTVGDTCSYQTFTNASATSTATVPDPGCANYLGGDVWFKVAVPAGGAVQFDMDELVMTDAGMAIYSGLCDNLTLIACDDNSSANGLMPKITAGGLTPGDSIWVRVWEAGNNNNGTFAICATIPPPPPANDEPCAAIALTVDSTCNYQNFTNATATGSLGIPAPGCAGYQGGDVWFKAVVPAGGAIRFDTQEGQVTDGGMAVYGGSCGVLNLLGCDDNSSANGAMPRLTIGGLTAGDTVWIRVWENGNDNAGSFGICATVPPPPPANDNPCAATPLIADTVCNFQTFTNENATDSPGVPAPGCASYQGGDVWFSVIVPANGSLIFDGQTGVIQDAGMAIYSGTCNNLTLIQCDDDDSQNGNMPFIQLEGQTPGDTLWIRIWEFGGDNNGTFGICVRIPPPPPVNDNPCTAITLAVDTVCNFQTFTNESSTGTVGVTAPGCAGYQGGDVWFNVIVPSTGTIVIDTDEGVNGMTDGGMAVYGGSSCAALNLLACDDNTSNNGLMPKITLGGLTPGDTLWVRMWEFGNNNNGTFGICASIPPPAPVNDDPCGATELIATTNCAFQTFTTLNSLATAGVPAPGCGNYLGGDVWFKVVVPPGGALVFDTQAGQVTDAAMAIYKGTCTGLTLIECDEDQSNNGLMSFIEAGGLVPGDTIWVRVWEEGNDNAGTFGICVTIPPPGPVNDNPCSAITLTPGTTCNYQGFTNAGAISTVGVPDPGCANYQGGDVWFQVTVPAQGGIIVDSREGTMLDGGMALYTGRCDSLVLVSCDDNNSVNGLMPTIYATGLTPGTIAWLRVWESGNNNNGTFEICVTIPPPQPTTISLNCPKDTTIACGTCFSLNAVIPNIHNSTDRYVVNPLSGPGNCFRPYVGTEDVGPSTNLGRDDLYTDVINLPFNFPFYGVNYNSLIASTNGYLSFDPAEAGLFSHYAILNNNGVLVANGGTGQNLPSALYDRALIMGPYHDIDPSVTTSPNRQIKYNVTGIAPNRRWILSFNKVASYNCNAQINNSHQIVLYEGSGLVEVFVFEREICTTWNDGRSMIGMQNFDRNDGIMAPGRRASDPRWGGTNLNESWRFTPVGGRTLFKRVELYDTSGNFIARGDTSSIDEGNLRVKFDSICPSVQVLGVTPYIVKTFYEKFDNPNAEVVSTDTINVNRNNILNVTYDIADPSCGVDNGSLVVHAAGTAPYTFSIDSGITNLTDSNFVNLAAGSYNVTVIDSTGCRRDTTILLEAQSPVIAGYTITPATCNGDTSGTVQVSIINGGSTYQFSSNGGATYQADSLFTLSAGTYTIRIRDSSGCVKDTVVVISEPPAITAVYDVTAATCTVGASLVIHASGGTPGYTYSKDGVTYVADSTFSLVTGANLISIKDSVGCVKDTTINVTLPGGLTFTFSTTPVSCNGGSNGSITVTPGNGTAPFVYSNNGGATFGNDSVFSSLTAGLYTIVIRDFNNCTKDTIVEVLQPDTITATYDITQAICAGNGTIVVHAQGGVAPYLFSNGGAFGTDSTFSVDSGTYTISIRDLNGCIKDTSIQISASGQVTATYTISNVQCNGAANGNITITPSGTAPYQYSVNGGTSFGPDSSFALGAGIYNVSVRDANGCVKDTVIELTEPAAITATYTIANALCNGGASGSITAAAAGGTAGYEYSIDAGVTYQPGGTFNALAANTYAVRIKDANGCTKDTTITITEPTAISATYTIVNAACNGAATGSITAVAAGGTAGYEYSIDAGATYQPGGVFNALAANNYTLRIRDANGCIKDTAITVAEPAAITASYSISAVSCNGGANGSITVTAAGGTAGYEYSSDNGASYQPAGAFTSLTSGSYSIRIRDANGCTKDTTIQVTEPVAIAGTYLVNAISCNGAANGSITITATGGTPAYEYSKDGGTTYQPGVTFSALDAASYTIRIRDANGCTKDSVIEITQPAALSVSNVAANATCSPTANGQVTVTATGGTGAYTYSADNFVTTSGTGVFGSLAQGNYTLSVRDANGCVATTAAVVGFTFDLTLQGRQDTAICGNIGVRLNTVSNAQSYSWSPATGLDNASIANPVATPAVTTEYILTVQTGSCTLKDTVVVNVSAPPVVNAGSDIEVIKGADAPIFGSVENAASYIWSPTTYLNDANILNPISVRPQETITYRLTATNSLGCSQFDEVTVTVVPYCIKPKNAFSPNGDGINDTWSVYDQYECLSNVRVSVYNRYGSRVYQSVNYRNDWRGTFGGNPLPDATYYYVIDYTLSTGKVLQIKGDVTILR